MHIEVAEVDPLDPVNEPLLHAMYDVSAAARADRPFEVWAPWTTAYATWTHPSPAHQTETLWAARLGDEVVAMAQLALPLLDNQHLALGQLFVRPAHRRRGVGTLLLDTMVERVRAAGRTVLMATPYSPMEADGPGQRMLAARGFEVGIVEAQKVCDLEATEHMWPALVARVAAHHADYLLEPWRDRVPAHLVAGYCEVTEAFIDEAPMGELDWEPETWTPERVAGRDDRFLATGRHQFGVLAFAPDGTCVAGTELFVNEAAPWRALQGSTIVLPSHRGHRLGMAVKLANHAAVRSRYAECRYAFTANADVNAPMNAVNDALGFRDVERAVEMQLRV